ncbi:iron-siderophore ABC transporter substrate-binding protein [Chlorogloeopsis sp. ULAP02]|uniref:iron-siderophore ABC transporter substrate-binding protein n=1 Tax=Chlorogloeopsis sp. ULAP02 TaxID=3107926 RepID=UPI003134813A
MIKKQSHRLIKPFLLMAFSLLLITACDQPVSQRHNISLKPSVECRVIQHKFGETCVPFKPQRIIALAPETSLDPLIALGIKPIGFTSYNFKGEEVHYGVSFDQVKGAKNVGDVSQPSLEKILMLKPDLILSSDRHQYKLLSAIAPSVPVSYPTNFKMPANKAFFKETLRYVAKIVGEETKAEEVLNQYNQRIEELKKRLGNQLEQIEISVIFYSDGWIGEPMKNVDSISTILTDMGVHQKFLSPGKYLNIETINEFDTDILFIIDVERKTSSFYFQHPIFSSLKVFKNNRVYFVTPEKWYTLGISGANKVLDDLFKYLPVSYQ